MNKTLDKVKTQEGQEVAIVEINKEDSTAQNLTELEKQDVTIGKLIDSLLEIIDDGDDNRSAIGAVETLLELGGYLKQTTEEIEMDKKVNKILGIENTSIYKRNQKVLDSKELTLEVLIKYVKGFLKAEKYNRQGDRVPDEGVRLKANKLLLELGGHKKRKKMVNETSITDELFKINKK